MSSGREQVINVNRSFGNWLKQRRKLLDLTQADLAYQVGCSTMTIRKIESDERRPSKQISERMADVLAISLEERAAFMAFARRVADAKPALLENWTPATPVGNLPPQSTPFIGRENELAQIADRLTNPDCQMLTLVGPGGIGKTRLALQAALERIGEFVDGVYFVSLSPVGSTTLIASAIASALQISFYGQEDPNKQVVNYLRGKHTLLVMDNYEHLLAGIGLLTDLLANAPRLKILATSRERLNMQEEWVLSVGGLPFPTQESNNALDSYSAIRLFVQTACRLQPGFSLEGNQNAVIDICQAVEGMPLGIELAATWLRAMPCQQIARQIRRNLDFLATPLRNIAERHRSLRAVFEHSWALLSDVERPVVMKLSVFRGSIDPEAAEQVAEASLLALASLVDKSLVRLNPAGRYEMHELLRQFAADKLLESGQVDETRHCHLQFLLGLAEGLEQQLFGPQQLIALDRLEIEHDNFRAALEWALQTGDAESGLRLGGALGWFWNRRNYLKEGQAWLKTLLAISDKVSLPTKARALHHQLELSFEIADYEYALLLCPEALTLAHEVKDERAKAWLLSSLGMVLYAQSEQIYFENALALFRTVGDQWGICETLSRLAVKLIDQGDYARADELQTEGIKLVRQAGDKSVLAFLLGHSAFRELYEGKPSPLTESRFQECLTLFGELGYKNGIVMGLYGLAWVAQLQGEYEQAITRYRKSISLAHQIDSKGGWIIECLVKLAEVFCANGDPKRGAYILGAMHAQIYTFFISPSVMNENIRLVYERALAAAHTQQSEATFAAAFAEGQMMTLDQTVAYALDKALM
jgi:predicted ATPase/transcriptional regulator with XRE-family HTH domain